MATTLHKGPAQARSVSRERHEETVNSAAVQSNIDATQKNRELYSSSQDSPFQTKRDREEGSPERCGSPFLNISHPSSRPPTPPPEQRDEPVMEHTDKPAKDSPPFTLFPFEPADALEAARLYNKAFEHDGIRLACFPVSQIDPSDPDEEVRWRAARNEIAASLPICRAIKAVDEGAGGRIVGAAAWFVPGGFQWMDKEGKEKEKSGSGMPKCCNVQAHNMIMQELEDARERLLEGNYNVWGECEFLSSDSSRFLTRPAELTQIFVDPDYQRKGIGKMLLDWGTEQADESGTAIYLEGTAAGMDLYERCGFIRRAEVTFPGIYQDGNPYTMYLMIREPRKETT